MKYLFNIMMVLVTLQFGLTSYAQTNKSSAKGFENSEMNVKVCKSFYKLVSSECARSICLQLTEQETDDCEKDGTFWEIHNMCVYDELLPNLIETYNKNNSTKKINCDAVEVEVETIVKIKD